MVKIDLFFVVRFFSLFLLFLSASAFGQITENFEAGLPSAWSFSNGARLSSNAEAISGNHSCYLTTATGSSATTPLLPKASVLRFSAYGGSGAKIRIDYSLDSINFTPLQLFQNFSTDKTNPTLLTVNIAAANVYVKFVRTGSFVVLDDVGISGAPTSVQSGSWDAGTTWDSGVPPAVGQDVVIASGTDVTQQNPFTVSPNTEVYVSQGGTLSCGALITNNGMLGVDGTLQIISGGAVSAAPVYGGSSTLQYQTGGTYGVYNEWTGNAAAAGLGIPKNVSVSTNTTLNLPNSDRGCAGNFTVTGTGAANMSPSSGDLYVGGNLTLSGNFTPNNRAVFLSGSAVQAIKSSGALDYMIINNSSQKSIRASSDLIVNKVLNIISGNLDLSNNGSTSYRLNIADGGTIAVGAAGSFFNTTSGSVNFLGNGTTTGNFIFYSPVFQTPSGIATVSYSAGTVINNSLYLNTGAVVSNAPSYATGSTLVYNTGGNYIRAVEWGHVSSAFPTNGYPYNVTVQNGTTLAISNGLTGNISCAGSLVLGTSSGAGSLSFGNTSSNFSISGDVIIGAGVGNSVLSLSDSVGGDIFVGGSWTRNATGTFTPNNRQVTFNGTVPQTITAYGGEVFDYLATAGGAAVTLASNVTVNKKMTSGGSVTVPSDISFIQPPNSVLEGSGQFTVVRDGNVASDQYNFWSSPVFGDASSGQDLYGIYPNIPANRVMSYVTATDYYKILAQPAMAVPGTGYSIKGPSAGGPVVTATFVGIPNNGNITVPLTVAGNNYNLIGNPYPSNLDLLTFYAANSGSIDSTVYFWDNSGNTATVQEGDSYAGNSFATINLASGNPVGVPATADSKNTTGYTPTSVATVGEGFIVKAKTAGPAIFTNDARNGTPAHFFTSKTAGSQSLFRLMLTTPSGITNSIAIYYTAGAQNIKDIFDSEPASVGSDALYSFADGSTSPLIIQGRASAPEKSEIIPLGAVFYKAGNYTLSSYGLLGDFAGGTQVYLTDKKTGKTTNLASPYSFDAAAGKDEGRFFISYSQGTLGIQESSTEKTRIIKENGDFVVRASQSITSVEVYDAAGRKTAEARVAGAKAVITGQTMVPGYYIARIKYTDGSMQPLKFIK